MMTWQPIDTVPMDTAVLTYGPTRGIEYVVLSVFHDDEDDYTNFNEDGEYIGNAESHIGRAIWQETLIPWCFKDLTYWIQLPPLPEALK